MSRLVSVARLIIAACIAALIGGASAVQIVTAVFEGKIRGGK